MSVLQSHETYSGEEFSVIMQHDKEDWSPDKEGRLCSHAIRFLCGPVTYSSNFPRKVSHLVLN